MVYSMTVYLLLLDLIDQWRTALDKFYIGALFMDLSKRFDCMQHALLVFMLEAYGLTKTFASYYVIIYVQSVTYKDRSL